MILNATFFCLVRAYHKIVYISKNDYRDRCLAYPMIIHRSFLQELNLFVVGFWLVSLESFNVALKLVGS